MDPEARVVVTARDQTAAAFNSANAHLKQFQRSAMGMKSLLASFGAVLSGRALLNWATGALRAADATGEHAVQIKEAQDALVGMKKASDDLAVSVAMELTPAFQGLGKVFTGLNALFFNADMTQFGKQIADVEEEIRELRKHAIDTGIGELLYSTEDKARLAELEAQLEDLNKKQRIALGLETDLNEVRRNMQNRQAMENMKRIGDLSDRLADQKGVFTGAPKKLDIEINWLEDPDGLEEILPGNGKSLDLPISMQLEQIDPNEVARLFKPIKDESKFTAEFLGESFRDSFSDWILGAERSFSDLLKRMAADMATSALFKSFATLFPGGSFFSNFFGGGLAEGGPLKPGKWHIAGEKGPEPIWGGGPGAFAAGYPSGGGMVFAPVYNIDARGADPSLANRLPGILAENNQRVKAEIRHEMGRRR